MIALTLLFALGWVVVIFAIWADGLTGRDGAKGGGG